MPFRLTRAQQRQRRKISDQLDAARNQIEAAVIAARDFAATVADKAEAEIARHPPEWRRTNGGKDAAEWAAEWRGFAPDLHDASAVDAFNALPDTAEE